MKTKYTFRLLITVLLLVIVGSSVNTASTANNLFPVIVPVIYDQASARESMQYINNFRTENGVARLSYDYELEKVAMQRAVEAAVSFSHETPDGGRYYKYLKDGPGTTPMAECLASAYRSPESVVYALQENGKPAYAQQHRQIMLDGKYKAVGVGHVKVEYASWGTQDIWVQIYRSYNSNTAATSARTGYAQETVVVDPAIVTMRLTLDQDSITMQPGQSINTPRTFLRGPQKTSALSYIAIDNAEVWTSSNPSVASVTGGVIRAHSSGTATLTCRVQGYSATVSVSVAGSTLTDTTHVVTTPTEESPSVTPIEETSEANSSVTNGTFVEIPASTVVEAQVPRSIENATVTFAASGPYIYSGTEVKPKATVMLDGKTLINRVDYTEQYWNCTASGTATLFIHGKGDYIGTKAVTYKIICSTPVINQPKLENAGITLSWSGVPGATKYQVLYRVGSTGTWKKLTTTVSNSVQIQKIGLKKPVSGTTYSFTVCCLDATGKQCSSYHTTGKSVKYSAITCATPKNIKVKLLDTSKLSITWSRVSGASRYRVFYKTSVNGSWRRLADVSGTSYTMTPSNKDATYIFTVRCISSDGTYISGYNAKGVSFRYLWVKKPTFSLKTKGKGKLQVTWSKQTSDTRYTVLYSPVKYAKIGFYHSTSDLVNKSTVTIRGLSKGSYVVRIVALRRYGGITFCPGWTNAKTITIR